MKTTNESRSRSEESEWIKDCTLKISNAIGGGSELFSRHGDEFRLDIDFVCRRIHETRDRHREAVFRAARAERAAHSKEGSFGEFNFNECFSVRLTDEGRRILAERHEEVRQRNPNVGAYIPKREDAEGRVSFQFWDLMNTFGTHMFMGNPRPPIDGEIRFSPTTSSWRMDNEGEAQC